MDACANVRTKIAQDEGSHDTFLDKCDWYERDVLKTVKLVKKSSFGDLLDRIEWNVFVHANYRV